VAEHVLPERSCSHLERRGYHRAAGGDGQNVAEMCSVVCFVGHQEFSAGILARRCEVIVSWRCRMFAARV
jgi:hypothetical protein